MLEKIREAWTLVGVLKRLLVTLKGIQTELHSLAETQKLALKLQVLGSGGTLQQLIDEDFDSPGEVELTETSDEDLAEHERIEEALRKSGYVPEDDEDLKAVRDAWKEK